MNEEERENEEKGEEKETEREFWEYELKHWIIGDPEGDFI